MGVGWRRFTERCAQYWCRWYLARQLEEPGLICNCRVRESTGLGSKGLEPTANLRCLSTLKEATEFAGHLKKCQRAIEGMKAATEVGSGLQVVCRISLP